MWGGLNDLANAACLRATIHAREHRPNDLAIASERYLLTFAIVKVQSPPGGEKPFAPRKYSWGIRIKSRRLPDVAGQGLSAGLRLGPRANNGGAWLLQPAVGSPVGQAQAAGGAASARVARHWCTWEFDRRCFYRESRPVVQIRCPTTSASQDPGILR